MSNAPRVVLSGYYGFDNYGDDLILEVLCQQISQRGAVPVVLSANPARTRATLGVCAIHRYNPLAILQELSRCQVLVSGGGGLFQDATGPNSVLYYGALIVLARWLGRPVAHLFQSVGPLRTGWGRWMTAFALRRCQFVAVRDEPSARLVAELTGQKPLVTSDLAWLSNPAMVDMSLEKRWRVGISLRPHDALTHDRLKQFAAMLRQLVDDSSRPVTFVLIPCQLEEDEAPLHVLQTYLQEGLAEHCAIEWGDETDVTHEIGRCHLLFGMRFHSVVMAVRQGVPVFGLVYDPKVQALLDAVLLKGVDVHQLETVKANDISQYFQQYAAVPQEPMREKALVALNALQALYWG